MTFRHTEIVRFAHVDAAGIVFYPRYFEMVNATVEAYFAQLGVDFATIHIARRLGVPTVRVEIDFTAPSRLGDLLVFELDVRRVGRSSAQFAIRLRCANEQRFAGSLTIVCIDLTTGKSVEWPEDLRPGPIYELTE